MFYPHLLVALTKVNVRTHGLIPVLLRFTSSNIQFLLITFISSFKTSTDLNYGNNYRDIFKYRKKIGKVKQNMKNIGKIIKHITIQY